MNIHDKISALRSEYVGSVLPDAETLEALYSEVAFGLEDDRTFAELRAMAHRHAGSAASFGLKDLSATARVVDQFLTNGERRKDVLMPPLEAWRHALMTSLR